MASTSTSSAIDCFVSDNFPFAKVCEALEFIDKSSSTPGKANVRETCQDALRKLFAHWRKEGARNGDPDVSAFPLIRLLLPHLDRYVVAADVASNCRAVGKILKRPGHF